MGVNVHNKENFKDCMDDINVKRALLSSVVFSAVLPFVIVSISIFMVMDVLRWTILIFGILSEIFQGIYAVIFYYLIKNREAEKYKVAYIIYYGITIAALMCVAAVDMNRNSSEIIYVATCIYFIFVPIFNEKVRNIFVAGQTILMVSIMVVVDMSIRCLVDTAIIQLGTVFVSRYQYNLTIKIERTSANLKMKTLYSEQDALTGLTNRRGLEKKAEVMWPYCQRKKIPVGMIALDIDFFKKYNDKFGHLEGDRCLKIIANTLKESAQRSTDTVTRTGGEEFLIFVQDVTPKEILELALKIRKNIENQAIMHAYCGISKYVTASMGISTTIPKSNYQFNDLYEEADRALYLAKKNGRNCIVFDGCIYGRMKDGMAKIIDIQ